MSLFRLTAFILSCALMPSLYGCATTQSDSSTGASGSGRSGDVEVVEAEGIGSSQEDALKQAFFSAVEQVVGAIVDAKIEVSDDEIIQDRILTLSDGYVQNYEVIGGPRAQDGVVHLTIRAAVSRNRLLSSLMDENVPVRSEVRGEALFAQAVTQDRVREQALEIIKALMSDDFRHVKAELKGEPTRVDPNELDKEALAVSHHWLKVPIRVHYDNTHFNNSILPRLTRVLESIATDHRRNEQKVREQTTEYPTSDSLVEPGSLKPQSAYNTDGEPRWSGEQKWKPFPVPTEWTKAIISRRSSYKQYEPTPLSWGIWAHNIRSQEVKYWFDKRKAGDYGDKNFRIFEMPNIQNRLSLEYNVAMWEYNLTPYFRESIVSIIDELIKSCRPPYSSEYARGIVNRPDHLLIVKYWDKDGNQIGEQSSFIYSDVMLIGTFPETATLSSAVYVDKESKSGVIGNNMVNYEGLIFISEYSFDAYFPVTPEFLRQLAEASVSIESGRDVLEKYLR
ncbi:MAG: hypothetical protein EOL87_16835 [Spartobacteria bacterium]|nr:hypothetical protein [Spartobacteria bacterium]